MSVADDAKNANDNNNVSESKSSSDTIFSYITNTISSIYISHSTKIAVTMSFIMTYLLWASLSYFSTHLYARICADWSITGFILHPFMAVSPHCAAIRWFIIEGPSGISQSFVLLSSFIIATLVSVKS